MREKLNDTGGLTVVEMLCAVIVLVLLCLMLNTGLHMAMQSYRRITAASETQLLLNTLVDAIADELRYAHQVDADPDGNLTYNDNSSLTISGGQVLAGGRELVPKEKNGKGGAYHGGTYQAMEIEGREFLSYDPGTACFTLHLKVTWTGGDISAETPEEGVTIRCLNPPKKEGTA